MFILCTNFVYYLYFENDYDEDLMYTAAAAAADELLCVRCVIVVDSYYAFISFVFESSITIIRSFIN